MKDLDNSEKTTYSDAAANKIVFIGLPIGNNGLLLGSDVAEQFMNQDLITGNRYTLSMNANTKEEANDIFKKLAEGGVVEMPIAESSWNTYFGMVTDQYGIQWMINFDPNQSINSCQKINY